MTKEELRQQLQVQFEQHLQANPDAVTMRDSRPSLGSTDRLELPQILIYSSLFLGIKSRFYLLNQMA